jgi:histone H3/H4
MKQAEIPLAPLRQVFKEVEAERVSRPALVEFRKVVMDYAYALAESSKALANHAGRKTVKATDVKVVSR